LILPENVGYILVRCGAVAIVLSFRKRCSRCQYPIRRRTRIVPFPRLRLLKIRPLGDWKRRRRRKKRGEGRGIWWHELLVLVSLLLLLLSSSGRFNVFPSGPQWRIRRGVLIVLLIARLHVSKRGVLSMLRLAIGYVDHVVGQHHGHRVC
jgi:hypothetical protein